MARFNTTGHKALPAVATVTSPIATVSKTPDTRTFEGAAGWTRTPKAELFLLASGAFLDGKGGFYESGAEQDARLRGLVSQLAVDDFAWLCEFAKWLRGPGNIRTASLMLAADAVKARLDAGLAQEWYTDDHSNTIHTYSNRWIIDAVCQRPDEPGELLAYWTSQYGRRIPKPVKRGLADVARRLYSEQSLLKYDTASKAYRFGDVLNLCHPRPKEMVGTPQWQYRVEGYEECPTPLKRRYATAEGVPRIHHKDHAPLRAYACKCGWYHATSSLTPYGKPIVIDDLERRVNRLFTGGDTRQGELFRHALDRRHNPATTTVPVSLTVIVKNKGLREHGELEHWLNADLLREAGMTWEDAFSAVGSKVDKGRLWEALIPSMPIKARLNNLRNFDETGVSDEAAQQVIAQLTDADAIAKSRLFPFRFLAAYRATKEAGSLRWAYPLEQALNHSLANAPSLGGRTLILVDRSPSMFPEYDHCFPKSKISIISRADQAALFGSALAVRAESPTLVEFHQGSREIKVAKGTSVLPLTESFGKDYGTDIPSAVRRHYANHDRVIILTDEQTRPGQLPCNLKGWVEETSIDSLIPLDVPVFMWNFAGYKASAMPSGSQARFTLGGLTDNAFTLIPLLEAGAQSGWPWQETATT